MNIGIKFENLSEFDYDEFQDERRKHVEPTGGDSGKKARLQNTVAKEKDNNKLYE